MKPRNTFFLIVVMTIVLGVKGLYAQNINGEVALGVKGIKFKDIEGTKPLSSLELGNRWGNVALFLSLSVANIDNDRFDVGTTTYLREINYYPVELNVKTYLPLKRVELGGGLGLSMNFLDRRITNELTDKEIEASTNILYGIQGMAEIKFLFPSTSGVDAFVGLEAEYQCVERAKTFLGNTDLTNYRIGIRLGGRF